MNHPTEEWTEGTIGSCTEREIVLSLKHEKMLKLSQRELQIETPWGYRFSSLRMMYMTQCHGGGRGLGKRVLSQD